MKNLKIEKKIELPGLKEVHINNELLGTRLVQGNSGEVVITADLYLRLAEETDEIIAEDFISVNIKEEQRLIEIDIEELDLDEDDYDLSHRSEITIALPALIAVDAKTENLFLSAVGMDNEFTLSSENGPIRMEECNGKFSVTNENGPIKLFKLNGDLIINEENGPVSADSLNGGKLEITSENGAVKLRDCQFDDVSIRNENGVVFYESLLVDAGSIEIQNENGHINLALSPLQGFSLLATAELGQIRNSFMGENTSSFDKYTLEVGDSALKIKLTTENGMIKLTSSDMISGDYLKGKMDYIREILKDNSEQGLAEAHKIIGQLLSSLSRMLEKINDETIKEKIEQAMALLKSWKAKINDPEMKSSVKESMESVSQEINKTIQEAMRAAQEAIKVAQEKYRDEFKPHMEKHFGKGKDFFSHFKGFRFDGIPPVAPVPPNSSRDEAIKEASQNRARMKILEMLEAGKITSEEAEKLLKAIH